MSDYATHAGAAQGILARCFNNWKGTYTPQDYAALAQVEALLALSAAIAAQGPQGATNSSATAASAAGQIIAQSRPAEGW